jgi:hypothetical protein
VLGCELGSDNLEFGPAAGSRDHGSNELSGSLRDHLSDYQLLKRHCEPKGFSLCCQCNSGYTSN